MTQYLNYLLNEWKKWIVLPFRDLRIDQAFNPMLYSKPTRSARQKSILKTSAFTETDV